MTTIVLHLRSVVKGREGQWYKQTAQYGYWGAQDQIDNIKCKKFYDAHRHEQVEKDMYACGFIGPNHPMPAIGTYTEFFSDRVLLWVHDKSWYYLEWSYD